MSLLLTLLTSSLVHATGFLSGNEFVSSSLYGNVRLICTGVNGGVSHQTCRANILDPGEFDYFRFDGEADATSVTLSNTVGGRNRSSTKKFDAKIGQSSKRFNLWVSSLTQRPLLDIGENKLSYSLTKNKKVVTSGEFEVRVTRGEDRDCRAKTMFSNNPRDCEFPTTSICDQYFYEENYCHYGN